MSRQQAAGEDAAGTVPQVVLEATVFAFHWHAEMRHATESVGKRRTWILGRIGRGLHPLKRGILCLMPSGFVNARTGVRGACLKAATVARQDSDIGDADFPTLAGSAAPRSQFSTDSAIQSFDCLGRGAMSDHLPHHLCRSVERTDFSREMDRRR
jgi:hypothetical protein